LSSLPGAAGGATADALGKPTSIDKIGIVNARRVADFLDRPNAMSVSLHDSRNQLRGQERCRVHDRLGTTTSLWLARLVTRAPDDRPVSSHPRGIAPEFEWATAKTRVPLQRACLKATPRWCKPTVGLSPGRLVFISGV
jgi:hypothetical protein